ncbi:MAG TPA: hypothetical protein VL984_17660 [Acidimicrobiales bacterium]|nr:hypothetical protein [Acidimicrobiales bacterium]
MAPLKTFARVAGTAAILATAGVMAMPLQAYALTSENAPYPTGVSLSPNPVQTTAQTLNGFYAGDAGVVTITLPAGSFPDSSSLRAEECNNDATESTECDGLTLQTTNANGTSLQANSDGSATVTFTLWELPTGNTPDAASSNNPAGFDPGSTVTCSDTVPCSIWIGPDPSNFSNESFVFDSVTPIAAATQGQVPESPSVPLLALSAVGVGGAGSIIYGVRRRRASHS